jgi:hypothetical protein
MWTEHVEYFRTNEENKEIIIIAEHDSIPLVETTGK